MMDAFETEQRTLWRVVPEWVPGRHRTEVRARTAELDRLMLDLVARARREGDTGQSLLSRLLAARDDEGEGMSDRELRDELVTLFLAGHETTSIALALTLWLLAEHPEHQDAVQDELDAVLGDRDPALADVPKLRRTEAVLKETMRLYPPAWAFGRETTAEIAVGGHRIPAGTQVIAAQWVIHRDPRFWVGADRFRPDRWLSGETDALPRMAYFPFGGGPRICVGNHFAMLEAVLVLATFLRHRRVRSVMGPPPELVPAVTLRPRHGIRVRVALR
jgi:cytochrome P450